jgi:hypothetical protein
MTANTIDPSACEMSRKKACRSERLHALAMLLWLACKAPGLLARVVLAYRGFQKAYVRAAVARGMQQVAAREIAGQLRPMALAKTFRKQEQ